MRQTNQPDTRTRLLNKISEVSFAVDDILLYLDTHPCCEEGLSYFEEQISERKKLMKEYARNYGPLTIDDAADSELDTWKWMEQPFPWEKEGACS